MSWRTHVLLLEMYNKKTAINEAGQYINVYGICFHMFLHINFPKALIGVLEGQLNSHFVCDYIHFTLIS